MFVCVPCMYECTQRPDEAIKVPGPGAQAAARQVLLTTELSPQPLSSF